MSKKPKDIVLNNAFFERMNGLISRWENEDADSMLACFTRNAVIPMLHDKHLWLVIQPKDESLIDILRSYSMRYANGETQDLISGEWLTYKFTNEERHFLMYSEFGTFKRDIRYIKTFINTAYEFAKQNDATIE